MRGIFMNKISRKMSCLSSRSLVIVWKVIICSIIMKRNGIGNEKTGLRGMSIAWYENIIGIRSCKW